MKIKTDLLPELFESVYKQLTERGYSRKTHTQYRGTYNRLISYLDRRSIDYFTNEVGANFLHKHYGKKSKFANQSHYVNLKLRIKRLFEVYDNGCLSVRRYTKPKKELKHLKQNLEIYKNMQQRRMLSPRTIDSKVSQIKKFFFYLESTGINNILDVNAGIVYRYLNLKDKKTFAVATKEFVLYILRDFFKSFADNGLCNKSLSSLFPQISTHSESPVPSCFSPHEVKNILSSVDRNCIIGKRDYAVILLASFLGIRIGDILNMKLNDIKWGTEMIEFTQIKTKKFLQLPMPKELKLALLDYLKNARPKIQSDYLFVKMLTPHIPYASSNSLWYMLKKYLGDIDVNGRKRGMHSLRFSAAGNMLSEGVNIVTICNILGHSYSDTTNHYLKIDINQLRKASLEVIK